MCRTSKLIPFYRVFPTKTIDALLFPDAVRMSHTLIARPDLCNNIWWKVQITKPLCYNFRQPLVSCSFSSRSFNQCSCLHVRHEVSKPYKTAKIIVLNNLIISFLYSDWKTNNYELSNSTHFRNIICSYLVHKFLFVTALSKLLTTCFRLSWMLVIRLEQKHSFVFIPLLSGSFGINRWCHSFLHSKYKYPWRFHWKTKQYYEKNQ